jgi:hypothetical protein
MENRSVKPTAPLVISPLEDEEGELFTCSTHKAVKSAMSIIESKYPNATYQISLHSGFAIFGLITLPRRTLMTVLNKLITRTIDFGYVGSKHNDYYNPHGTRVLDVKIEVSTASWRDETKVRVTLSTYDPSDEEE